MKKKIGIIGLVLCICLGILYPGTTVFAATGNTSVSVSAGTLNIGDTVTATVTAAGPAGEKTIATMTVSYDTNVLQFVSCNASAYGGGGSTVTATGDSFSVTLKAVAAGSSSVSVSATDGVLFDTTEELTSMAGSSATVTVNNAAATGGNGSTGTTGGTTAGGTTTGGDTATTASADNSLKSLVLSAGTLSPAFTAKTTKYSATVANDVTNIAVTATPANAKATVESVTGNDNLSVGNNTIKIVVKAENGVTATYSINVTRQGEGASEVKEDDSEIENTSENENETNITVDGIAYHISEDFTAEQIPADFEETTVIYQGTEYKGLGFTKGSISLLYLEPTGQDAEQGRFFIYDETRDVCYPFVKLTNNEKYVIALLAPVDFTVPENYTQTTVSINESESMTAYQQSAEEDSEIVSDFSMFYGVNEEGAENWYQYDSLENTYQRHEMTEIEDEDMNTDMEYLQGQYTALSEAYKKEKSFARNTIALLVFAVAVLIIIIINLLLHGRKKHDDFPDDDFPDDDFPDDDASNDDTPKRGFFAKKQKTDDLAEEEPVKRREKVEKPEKTLKPEKTEKHKEEKEDIEILDLNNL